MTPVVKCGSGTPPIVAGRLAVAHRRALAEEYQRVAAEIAEYELILASPDKQRELVSTQQGEELAKDADPDGSSS